MAGVIGDASVNVAIGSVMVAYITVEEDADKYKVGAL